MDRKWRIEEKNHKFWGILLSSDRFSHKLHSTTCSTRFNLDMQTLLSHQNFKFDSFKLNFKKACFGPALWFATQLAVDTIVLSQQKLALYSGRNRTSNAYTLYFHRQDHIDHYFSEFN